MSYNRLSNTKNPYQGEYKKVLCVCSAGLLRSPTAAVVLCKPPYNYNTRAAGMNKEYALIPVDEALIVWADEIVCMTKDQELELKDLTEKPILCLDIEDNYEYRNEKLQMLIAEIYDAKTKRKTNQPSKS
jgi:predicted protein tyrosine phosphatase